jgi:aryl-alcohol dehydrogenase-like predicted oxidoreductase
VFGPGRANTSRPSERVPDRYDLSLPGNQRKLEAVTVLETLAEEAGMLLAELALAFVLAQRDVTCPIIGPRTMEQLESQLPAAKRVLDTALLDRIDEIVPPGTNLHATDAGWTPPSLVDPSLRRR